MTEAAIEIAPSISRKYKKRRARFSSDPWPEIPGSGDSGKTMRYALAQRSRAAGRSLGDRMRHSPAERFTRAARLFSAFRASAAPGAKSVHGLSRLTLESWPPPRIARQPASSASRTSLPVSSLDRAAGLLSKLVAPSTDVDQAELRIRVARTLRRAAIDQSQASPRIASIALLLSDALVNSPGKDLTPERRQALSVGLDLLMDSFVPQEKEAGLFRALLDAGWEITGPFNRDEFADLLAEIGG